MKKPIHVHSLRDLRAAYCPAPAPPAPSARPLRPGDFANCGKYGWCYVVDPAHAPGKVWVTRDRSHALGNGHKTGFNGWALPVEMIGEVMLNINGPKA